MSEDWIVVWGKGDFMSEAGTATSTETGAFDLETQPVRFGMNLLLTCQMRNIWPQIRSFISKMLSQLYRR